MPIAGYGPGSFPFILQQTGYFDVNSYAPRHPDSALLQALGEIGLLGLVGVAIVASIVVSAVRHGRSRSAKWALTAFCVAGLAANPSDFPFLNTVALGWLAYSLPRAPANERAPIPVAVRSATLAAVLVIFVAYLATVAGGVAYDGARNAISEGDLEGAIASLEVSQSLDPGLALYARVRGVAELELGRPDPRSSPLMRATRLNGSDDLTWRSLAIAQRSAGRFGDADMSLRNAIRLQRSDPTNLLLLARWQADDGKPSEAEATLAEVVAAWPTVVAAPEFADALPEGSELADIIQSAVARWARAAPSPEPFPMRGLWLTVMAHRPELTNLAVERSGPFAPARHCHDSRERMRRVDARAGSAA